MQLSKETTSQVLDAFKVCQDKLFAEIKNQHKLHEKDDDHTKAYHTRKAINKWFARAGNI